MTAEPKSDTCIASLEQVRFAYLIDGYGVHRCRACSSFTDFPRPTDTEFDAAAAREA